MDDFHKYTNKQEQARQVSEILIEDNDEVVDAPCIVEQKQCFCGGAVKPLVSSSFPVRWYNGRRARLRTTLYYCKSCGLSIRGLDCHDPLVATHYELTQYTDPQREEHWRKVRRKFFNWFVYLVRKHLGEEPKTVLDFGCSYGHLLDIFAEKGAETTGIEIAPQMVKRLKDEGRHRIYSSIEDPEIRDGSFDAITAVDSIYYCGIQKPDKLFMSLARKLKPTGVLIARITNRNLVYKIYALLWHLSHGQFDKPAPIPYLVCGDGLVNYSEKAITNFLAMAGLEKTAVYRWEPKTKRLRGHIRNVIAFVLYYATLGMVDMCSGLVVVARKQSESDRLKGR